MPRPTPPREVPIKLGPSSDFTSFNEPTRMAIDIVRGDAFRMVFRLCEDVEQDPTYCGARGISPQTLDGYEARFCIRPAVGHNGSTVLTAVVDETTGSGRVTISATPEQTRTLYEYGGVFDVELSDGTDTFFKTVILGNVRLLRDVSIQG